MGRLLPDFKPLPTKPVCQCDPQCQRAPMPNMPWCGYHKPSSRGNNTRKASSCQFSPISGFEPIFNPNAWSKNKFLKESHNCFAYAIDTVDPKLILDCKKTPECDVGFPQPGYNSGHKKFADQKEKGCADMVSRLWGDNPRVKTTEFSIQCPNRTSKIALIVDPKRDYHFLRQDPDGYWSHKPGALQVKREDSTGRPIIRPDRAMFIYKDKTDPIIYTHFCGYFCVPRGEPLHMSKESSWNKFIETYERPVSPGSKNTRYNKTRRRRREEVK